MICHYSLFLKCHWHFCFLLAYLDSDYFLCILCIVLYFFYQLNFYQNWKILSQNILLPSDICRHLFVWFVCFF